MGKEQIQAFHLFAGENQQATVTRGEGSELGIFADEFAGFARVVVPAAVGCAFDFRHARVVPGVLLSLALSTFLSLTIITLGVVEGSHRVSEDVWSLGMNQARDGAQEYAVEIRRPSAKHHSSRDISFVVHRERYEKLESGSLLFQNRARSL